MKKITNQNLSRLNSNRALDTTLAGLVIVAAISGIGVGIVGGGFHWFLREGSSSYMHWLSELKVNGFFGAPGWLGVILFTSFCVGLARWLVTFAPSAAGSGVQHVEAVMRNEASPAPLRVLPVKFFGGLLAMIPGLALGREGPTIQMAAIIGSYCGRIFRLSKEDIYLLYTAVAGAGLSVAFNAPMAGAAFVVEEVVRKISTRSLLVTLTAIATSISVFRAFFGNTSDFHIDAIHIPALIDLFVYSLLGLVIGVAGALYNRNILLGLNLFNSFLLNVPAILKAACIGGFVGLLAYWKPFWIGSGEPQTQIILLNPMGVDVLLTLFVVRWLLGSISYSPGLPGGLFAPLLLLGASSGAMFAGMMNLIPWLSHSMDVAAFALVGMATFFTAVVRAPFTGVLLVIEMSGNIALTPALLLASVVAMVITTHIGSQPIYESLRARMISK